MGQKKSGNEHLLRARSERLEGLLDLYTRGVIDINDFIRLKTLVKIPAQTAAPAAETEPPRSGSTKKQELRQIRDEIRRRENTSTEEPEFHRGLNDISLYSSPMPSAEKFSTEPMITESFISELQSAVHQSVPAAVLGIVETPAKDPEPAKQSGLSRSGLWISSSMAAVSRSPRSIAAVAATFLIASVLTIGIARSGPVNQFVNTLQPQNSAASAFISQSTANSFIQPSFGPQAVRRCLDLCLPVNPEATCGRACNHLTLSEFARRITAQEINPAEEARRSANQCNNQARRRFSEESRIRNRTSPRAVSPQGILDSSTAVISDAAKMYHGNFALRATLSSPVSKYFDIALAMSSSSPAATSRPISG